MWQGFTERTGVSAAQLGELEMVGMGQFICGLQQDEVQQLTNDSFRLGNVFLLFALTREKN